MYAYELLPRLIHLTLTGKDEDGYEFIGINKQWAEVEKLEQELSNQK